MKRDYRHPEGWTRPAIRRLKLYMARWAGPPDIAIGNAGPFVVQK